MNRVALLFAYEGTSFSGYQVQPEKRTVQGEMERALMKLHKGEHIRVHSAGRTDTGVHAKGQTLHFDSKLMLERWQWVRALNSSLPQDIRVLEAAIVSNDFHARFDATKRHYRYRILRSEDPDVFRRNVTYHHPAPLDVNAMRKAANTLVGTHDFTSFCVANTTVEDKVRTIDDVSIIEENDELIFAIIGNGFLHNMVRIIVGTLIEIGTKKRDCVDMTKIIAKMDRSAAGKTAPGHGLLLWEILYETSPFLHKE